MNKGLKTVIIVIIIVLAVFFVYKYMHQNSASNAGRVIETGMNQTVVNPQQKNCSPNPQGVYSTNASMGCMVVDSGCTTHGGSLSQTSSGGWNCCYVNGVGSTCVAWANSVPPTNVSGSTGVKSTSGTTM